jgi:hypothetical protein
MLKENNKVVILDKTISGNIDSLPRCKWKVGDIAYVYSIEWRSGCCFLKKTLTGSYEYGLFRHADVKLYNSEQDRLNIKYGGIDEKTD